MTMPLMPFKEVTEFPEYLISDCGVVYSKRAKKIISLSTHREGYLKVQLWKDGKPKTKLVHTLVAEAFISPRIPGKEVNHKDGNKTNNFYENLEWSSRAENTKHAWDSGLIKSNPIRKLAPTDIQEILRLVYSGLSQTETAKRYNVSQPLVSQIVKRIKYHEFNEESLL